MSDLGMSPSDAALIEVKAWEQRRAEVEDQGWALLARLKDQRDLLDCRIALLTGVSG